MENKRKPLIIVVYNTQTGNTEKMAKEIAEGAVLSGGGVKVVNSSKVDVKDLLDADAVAVGSPTRDYGLMWEVKMFLKKAADISLKDKVGVAFSSYGWGGGAVNEITKILKSYGMRVIEPGLEVKGSPDQEEIDECWRLGKKIIEKIEKGAIYDLKKDVRDKIKTLRDSQDKKELAEKSALIQARLLGTTEFRGADTILFYVGKCSEVKTEGMIKDALKQRKNVLVPITDKENRRLLLSELKDFDRELAPGEFGVLEPKKEYARIHGKEGVDLIIAPGIAFDSHGGRVGYGLGYYDSLLSEFSEDVRKIGLAYEFQVVDNVPKTKYDRLMDKIITEERVIECESNVY